MKWRNLLIWVFVLAGLGVFVYLYEFKGEPKREAAKEKAEKLFDVKDPDIASMTIQRGPETTELDRKNGQWELVSPVSATADQSTLNDIASNLSTTSTVRSLAGDQNFSQYGLQPPKIQVKFKTRQAASFELDLGDKDYSDTNVYAKASNRPEVVLIPSSVFTSLDKSQFQLRDRKILEFDADQAAQIDFASSTGRFQAQKSGADWRIVQPVSTAADASSISSFLSDVTGAQVAQFVDHPDVNLKKYGLQPPVETLTVTMGQGAQAQRKELLIGSKAGDKIYAKVDGAPAVFEIDSTTVDKLRPDPFKLRDKRLVTEEATDLQRVSIEVGKTAYVFDRDNSKEGSWKVMQPTNLAGKTAQEWKFWFPLEDLTADQILDPPKSQSKAALFVSPAVKVTIIDKSNHPIQVLFSKPEKDSVWVQRSDSKSIYRVTRQKVDDWTSGLKSVSD